MGIVIDSNGVIDIAASTPGTYRITYTTAGTCPNSSFQDVTINALPTISIAGTSFCAGQSTTLTATPSTGTFIWEVNTGSGYNVISGQTNNTISVNTAGDYRAKVTDANGCTSVYSNVLAITQFASPSVTIATVPGTTICTGDTATLTANPTGGSGSGYTYLWSTSATTQAINVSPTTTTTYSVTVTDSNGCTATASQEITASTAGTTIAAIDNNNTMTFNGIDAYINTNYSIPSGNKTISFWFNSSYAGYQSIMGNTSDSFILGYWSSQFAVPQGISYLQGSTSKAFAITASVTDEFADGNWHHFVYTYDGNSKIYIDGTERTISYRAGTLSSDDIVVVENLGLGLNITGYPKYSGKLDEVAIFNTALSSCDVKGIYEATTTVSGQPKTANLLDANTTIPAPVYWNRMGDS